MMQKLAAVSFTVLIRPNRYVFDEQVSCFWNNLDQGKQLPVFLPEIDDVFHNGQIIVRGHRQWLTPDDRYPFGVGSAS